MSAIGPKGTAPRRLLAHLAALAEADGRVSGAVGDFAKSLGLSRPTTSLAMRRLIGAGAVRCVVPGHGNGHPPVWAVDRAAALPPDFADHLSGFAVSDEENRTVSARLLARLLKFHGERAPSSLRAQMVEYGRVRE